MRQLLAVAVILLFCAALNAQANPVKNYLSNPTPQSFSTAFNHLADKVAQDSTLLNYKVLMAQIAVMESGRLAQEVYPYKEKLTPGQKFQFANLLLAQNNFEEAIGIYDEINRDTPDWSCPWRHKGEAYYKMKDYKGAETALAKSIETNKEHYDAYIWMAKAQYEQKKYKQALKNLETALTLNPEAEESDDESISEESINALYRELLKKTGRTK